MPPLGEVTAQHPRADLDCNDPNTEGLLEATHELTEAFDADRVTEIIARITDIFGPPIKDATLEPLDQRGYRAIAYHQGGWGRRAWNCNWEKVPKRAFQLATDAQERLHGNPTTMLLQWAEHLPFVMVVLRTRYGPGVEWLRYAADGLFDLLPGRLGPTNIHPRVSEQLVICGKLRKERMERIHEAMEHPGNEATIQRELSEGMPLLSASRLLLERTSGNILTLEGGGGCIMGESPYLPEFRAFLFSSGNLGSMGGREWYLPMWIPAGMGDSWHDFDFHPFIIAATRNAEHVTMESGRLDEQLNRALNLPQAERRIELVRLHRELQRLKRTLHLGQTRSRLQADRDPWPKPVTYAVKDSFGFFGPDADTYSSRHRRQRKLEAEEEAAAVIESMEKRVDRALDLATAIENQRLNRSMQRWTIVAAGLAAIALLKSGNLL